MLPARELGASGIDVSVLSLGSWRTFERIPREQGLAVMREARERGITVLDDARYNDETGKAPLATGYSEVVFGELFRAAAWRRDEVVVANKLWWEFWPEESAAQELDGSLTRMGLDHLDLVYAAEPPEGLSVAEVAGAAGDLIDAGKIRAWGVLNWPPELLREAASLSPAPCAAQLPYNLVLRELVEGVDLSGISVVASMALWFGALTGKYPSGSGRLGGQLEDPRVQRALEMGERVREAAARHDTTPAAVALAFALNGPGVASVLFGATTPEQIAENVRAVDVTAEALLDVQ